MNKIVFFLLTISVSTNLFSQKDADDFQDKFVYHNVLEYKKEMQFMIEPNGYLINPNFREYHIKGRGLEINLNNFKGKIFTFLRYENREIKTRKGKITTKNLIFENEGKEYEYDTHVDINDSNSFKYFRNVEELVFYDDILLAKELLLNKTFYLIKKLGYKTSINKPYRITAVEANTVDFPVKIIYEDIETGLKDDFKLFLSGTNKKNECNSFLGVCDFNDYFITKEAFEKQERDKYLEQQIIQKELDAQNIKNLEDYINSENEEWTEIKSNCLYQENRIDEFTNLKNLLSETYNLNEPSYNVGEINIALQRIGTQKFIRFYTNFKLECVSPYSNNQSFVKVKLVNNDILTFLHIGDIECGEFELLSKLSETDITRLKKSPIKTIRLTGTKYYHDVETPKWASFFIDKLDCIK